MATSYEVRMTMEGTGGTAEELAEALRRDLAGATLTEVVPDDPAAEDPRRFAVGVRVAADDSSLAPQVARDAVRQALQDAGLGPDAVTFGDPVVRGSS